MRRTCWAMLGAALAIFSWAAVVPLAAGCRPGQIRAAHDSEAPSAADARPPAGEARPGDRAWPRTDASVVAVDGGPPICHAEPFALAVAPAPDLMLVLDQSGSMREFAPRGDGTYMMKMDALREAVSRLIAQLAGKVRFGLILFPGPFAACMVGRVTVPPSSTSAPEVDDAVQWAIPAGGTPTGESLQVANAYFMANRDPVRKAYVLLGTDGVPTCPNTGGTIPGDLNDPNLAIDAALAIQAVGDLAAAGVPTYVIGIGAELNESNPGVLDQMAQSGGTARSGERKYYAADNLEELGQAMSAIGGEIVSCTFALDETPQGAPDERADNLYVRFNGEEVARDPTHHDGWDYDAESNTITFYGAACERIQSGTVYEIKVLYGCGGVE